MNSAKCLTIVSDSFVVELVSTNTKVEIAVKAISVRRTVDAIAKFIEHTSTFVDDSYTRSLSSNEKTDLYVERILSFIANFDSLKYSRNRIPKRILEEVRETSRTLARHLSNGYILDAFSFDRSLVNSMIPEHERVKIDMIASSSQINAHNKKSQTNSNNDKISYKAFVDCEAIMLAKQALKFEEFWEALPETDY